MSKDPLALLQQADRMVQSASGGFSFFSNKESKYQDAADLYIEAANSFKLQKMMQDAGAAFERAAAVQSNQLRDLDDAANTMVDAYKAYRMSDPKAAARCIESAIQRYCVKGNFRRAATHKESLGELYENEMGDKKSAAECYETAAGWYESDNAQALANKLYLKVADVAALDGDYSKAISNYEKVAMASIDNNLMKYSVKDYFLKAGICHLASGDLVSTQRAIAKYAEMDPSFVSQRENLLLNDLYQAFENGDRDAFTDKLYQYDQISKLDKWKTTMLVKAKNNIAENEMPGVDGEEEEFA